LDLTHVIIGSLDDAVDAVQDFEREATVLPLMAARPLPTNIMLNPVARLTHRGLHYD
jgi:hypothetical protein